MVNTVSIIFFTKNRVRGLEYMNKMGKLQKSGKVRKDNRLT